MGRNFGDAACVVFGAAQRVCEFSHLPEIVEYVIPKDTFESRGNRRLTEAR